MHLPDNIQKKTSFQKQILYMQYKAVAYRAAVMLYAESMLANRGQ